MWIKNNGVLVNLKQVKRISVDKQYVYIDDRFFAEFKDEASAKYFVNKLGRYLDCATIQGVLTDDVFYNEA